MTSNIAHITHCLDMARAFEAACFKFRTEAFRRYDADCQADRWTGFSAPGYDAARLTHMNAYKSVTDLEDLQRSMTA